VSVRTMLSDHNCYMRTGAAIRRFCPHATDRRITERCEKATCERDDAR
jgi:hypothetical protein